MGLELDGLCSGRSQRLGRFWDFGFLGGAVQAPSGPSARPQLLALLAGGRGADWRWPGDQLRFTFYLEVEDVEKALAHALCAETEHGEKTWKSMEAMESTLHVLIQRCRCCCSAVPIRPMSAMPDRESGTFSSHVSISVIQSATSFRALQPLIQKNKNNEGSYTNGGKNLEKKTQGRVIRIPASGAAGTDVHSGSEMLPRACACTWFPPTYRPGMLLVPAVVHQPGRRPQGTAQGPCSNPRQRGSDLGIAQVHGPGWAAAGTVVIVILFSSG